MKPTTLDVLRAVDTAISPWSCYIHDEIQRWHLKNVVKGIKGHPPTMALVLNRLKSLERDGLLTRSTLRKGAYGYRWTITPKGNDASVRANAHVSLAAVKLTLSREYGSSTS